VRLFERVKITRRLTKAKKSAAALEAAGEEVPAEMRELIEQASQDLEVRLLLASTLNTNPQSNPRPQPLNPSQYVLHFPKGEKYVSVLITPEDAAERARVEGERLRLRALVKRQLADTAAAAEGDETLALAVAAAGGDSDGDAHDDFFASEVRSKRGVLRRPASATDSHRALAGRGGQQRWRA